MGKNGVACLIAYGWTPSTLTWYHILYTRASNVHTLYINGTQVGQATDSFACTQNGIRIGSDATPARSMFGYIDEVQAWNGVAISPTVPTKPLIGGITLS